MNRSESVPRTVPADSKRDCVLNINPQPGLRWLVCKNQVKGIGRGVTVIVFVQTKKVLKFDLFEQNAAHYHIFTGNPEYRSGQLALQESCLDDLVKRLLFELQYNLSRYLRLNHLEEVQTFVLDRKRIMASLADLESAIRARGSF